MLLEDGIPTDFNTKIFSKVLIRLTNERVAHKDIAIIVADNFDRLAENVRNACLLRLANNKDIAEDTPPGKTPDSGDNGDDGDDGGDGGDSGGGGDEG